MKMLAFDLGASSGKLFLGQFDGRRLSLETVKRFDNHPILLNQELFWNALSIFESLKAGIYEACSRERGIQSIGMDSFSNDFGLLDKDGRFITQVHCYRDERTQRNLKRIFSLISKERLYHITGNQIALFSTFMQLAAMGLEQQGFLLEGAGSLLFLPDLFTYFLTGQVGSEYTISSVSQLLDMTRSAWSAEILGLLGIPLSLFPPLVMPGTTVGEVRRELLPAEAGNLEVVAVCEHDTASAFLAAPHGSQSIIISSGTWSLVGVETPGPVITDSTFRQNFANEGGYPGHHRLLKNVMGLWIIQECMAYFDRTGNPTSILDLVAQAAEARAFPFMIDPNAAQFFAPGNMPEKILDYCRQTGQPIPQTPGEITRGVLESLAFAYRNVIDDIESTLSRHFEGVNIIGGGSENHLLNQFTANACGRQVLAGPVEGAAVGNLLVQLIAHRAIANPEEGRQVVRDSFNLTRFDPQDQALWDERYEQYLHIIRRSENKNGR